MVETCDSRALSSRQKLRLNHRSDNQDRCECSRVEGRNDFVKSAARAPLCGVGPVAIETAHQLNASALRDAIRATQQVLHLFVIAHCQSGTPSTRIVSSSGRSKPKCCAMSERKAFRSGNCIALATPL